jgi:hypothetical protein
MSRYATAVRLRTMALLTAIAASVAMCFSLAGPASKANAEPFCSYVWVKPYGQPGDRCTADTWRWLFSVLVRTYEHSGCVDAVDVYYNLVRSWTCTAGPESLASINFYLNEIPRKGIIRNNTTGSGAHLTGNQEFYQ